MVATGKRLIPVELLRRSCRRAPTTKEDLTSNENDVTKRLKRSPETEARAETPVKAKEEAHAPEQKVRVKQEPRGQSPTGERKFESAIQPDGLIEVSSDELDLERTLLGGQSFRWRMASNNQSGDSDCKSTTSPTFTGIVGEHVLQLWRTRDGNQLAYRKLNKEGTQESEKLKLFLEDYLQLRYKLTDLYDDWSQRDEHFKRCSQDYRGFRILRQDPVENVFSFICATNNNIKRISLMVDKMCQHFGTRLEMKVKSESRADEQSPGTGVGFYTFPTIERLAQEDVFDLLRHKLGFGYRAKFICETAKRLMMTSTAHYNTPATTNIDIDKKPQVLSGETMTTSFQEPRDYLLHLRRLPYRETCKRLQEFPGIGRKVADCICLMSMDHLGSVPIDCHIYEIVCRNYLKTLRQERKTLTENVHDLIGEYFTKLHGPMAGWATSVLFIGELRHLKQQKEGEDKTGKRPGAKRKTSK